MTKKNQKEEAKTEKVFSVGKRKRAVARAVLNKGSGIVRVNSKPTDIIEPEMLRLKLQEPVIIAGEDAKLYDINVNVKGGGISGQIEAARQSIARALVAVIGDNLKKKYLEYDRNLLAYDPRRTEPHKPPRSSQGPRRYKQRSKR